MAIYTFSYAISAFISWVKVPNTSASTDATTSQCLIEGTLVETVDGSIPIEEIKVGDEVDNYGGLGKMYTKLTIDGIYKGKAG